ncbi:hypothetical protein AN640_06095 [Candidatus Epulonipiscium fishelsonii]|uniref:Uncharacterized protein n=1 Tax=Candidatus Epulonipiscium fishelsonii TaxID=77094 RepID=A0ACC8XHS7_9FIRM|nr:hypothetical protein AN640_06095 [Epulopiscium sp. SCG-D08WGA-EpuloA1]
MEITQTNYNKKIDLTYESAKKEGIELGIKQGIQQGIVQGIVQGIEQGIAQGIDIGIKAVLDVLNDEQIAERFKVPVEKVKQMRKCM